MNSDDFHSLILLQNQFQPVIDLEIIHDIKFCIIMLLVNELISRNLDYLVLRCVEIARILSRFFRKNFVKVMVLLNKEITY